MIPVQGYKGARVGVLGLGRSGLCAARALHAGGAIPICWDDNEAARAIDLYKADTGKRKTKSKSAAQAVGRTSSSAPSTNQRAAFSESQIESMTDSEFSKNEEAIKEAVRNGSFNYDLTGAAR